MAQGWRRGGAGVVQGWRSTVPRLARACVCVCAARACVRRTCVCAPHLRVCAARPHNACVWVPLGGVCAEERVCARARKRACACVCVVRRDFHARHSGACGHVWRRHRCRRGDTVLACAGHWAVARRARTWVCSQGVCARAMFRCGPQPVRECACVRRCAACVCRPWMPASGATRTATWLVWRALAQGAAVSTGRCTAALPACVGGGLPCARANVAFRGWRIRGEALCVSLKSSSN